MKLEGGADMASHTFRGCNVAKKTAPPTPEPSQPADALLDELVRLLARIAAREHTVEPQVADLKNTPQRQPRKRSPVRPRARGPPRE